MSEKKDALNVILEYVLDLMDTNCDTLVDGQAIVTRIAMLQDEGD